MDTTLFSLYMNTIAYGLTLPDAEVIAYHVTDGTEHDSGSAHAALRWHERCAKSDPTAIDPWAMASVAQIIAMQHDAGRG